MIEKSITSSFKWRIYKFYNYIKISVHFKIGIKKVSILSKLGRDQSSFLQEKSCTQTCSQQLKEEITFPVI